MGCCGCAEDENEQEPPTKGTNQQRSCTDVIWLALFIVFWLFMILIAAFALVYGNPTRLRNGYDSYGNTCGIKNNEKIGDIALSGLDTSEKPYLFYLDVKNLRHSLQICVKQCPDRNINTLQDLKSFMNRTGSSLCTYDFDIFKLDDEKLRIAESTDSFTSSLGPCPPLPVYYSGSVLHRCVPKPVKELAAQVVGGIYSFLNSWDTIEQVLSDLFDTWEVILALCGLALVLALFLVAILHFVASMVSYIIMIAVSIACVVATGILWYAYASVKWSLDSTDPMEHLEKSIHNERAILVYAILATIFTVIILLVVWALRKRIGFLAQLFRESSECLIDMPYLFVQPFVTFLALLAFFAFWISIIVCLATATYPGSRSLAPLFEPPEAEAAGVTNSPYPGNTVSTRIGNVSVRQLRAHKFVEFIDATWVRYMWWVYLIGLIWTSEFILACQQMVIAGAVAIWYFDGGRKSVGSPVLTSITNLVSYHLGSMALGSLLITILKVPRLILTYIYAKLKNNEESECAKCGLKCCICCFYCLEKCVRFMNHNAYTVIAMQGINFCSAARRAFGVLVSNALQLATINSVGDFILFLGKCFVTAVTASIGLLLLKRDPDLKFYAVPVLVIAIFSYFIAHCVLSLYEVVIDTLFLCMCEDHSMNGDAGNWKKSTVVELQQQAIAQRGDGNGGQDEVDEHTQNTVDEDIHQPAELTPINEQ
ncbi:CTL-like protein 1 [Thrips palmi]|uniref:Choline transporter-like protein n=1 Tax=Thrips palmi TaxID=161013 RepID=A0A6P8YUY9_THRPL|nr:CTL-like protein 1 [Thrips palmi]XP_034241335.1 CTL-like protein 1 [Thrips palmi]